MSDTCVVIGVKATKRTHKLPTDPERTHEGYTKNTHKRTHKGHTKNAHKRKHKGHSKNAHKRTEKLL